MVEESLAFRLRESRREASVTRRVSAGSRKDGKLLSGWLALSLLMLMFLSKKGV
jgi:hypothetical protein